jgi:hypothetical protein
MNWNGQRETLDHLIRNRIQPERARANQSEFNSKRRSRIESALHTRPFHIPLTFNMAAAGQVVPYRDTTPPLNFDFIITGIKSDSQTRELVIRRTEDEKPIAYVGEETNLHLRADDIAGLTATNGGGQVGTFYLPKPIMLYRSGRLTVEIFKTDTTAAAEEVNIVLIGVRVFKKEVGELALEKIERERIDFLMQSREAPRTIFLKQAVEFSSAVAGGTCQNLLTPEVPEPLLVLGVRTNLRQSLIQGLRIEGEPNWMSDATPIWGVMGEDELMHENYQWFSRPVFLRSKQAIEIERITNSIDGTNLDSQTDNFITWICETV